VRFVHALLLCGAGAVVIAAATPAALAASAEEQLRRALDTVAEGRLNAAIEGLDRLIERHPNFRLAHLVRGDVLLALSAAQAHAIVVDAARSRVYVYENDRGEPRLVADYYSTLGKRGIDKLREGDQKTPLGVYHVTSMIPGAKLPDLYGWGAFPINYPNDWDRRAGKTGYGIWLHGVPSENYARAPRASASGSCASSRPGASTGKAATRRTISRTMRATSAPARWISPPGARASAG